MATLVVWEMYLLIILSKCKRCKSKMNTIDFNQQRDSTDYYYVFIIWNESVSKPDIRRNPDAHGIFNKRWIIHIYMYV